MRHRDGKKSGTIFSKQSSEEGGRFEKIHFCCFQEFHIYSDQSFVSFKIIQISRLKPKNKSKMLTATKTKKLSELQKRFHFSFSGASETNIALFTRCETNIIDNH